jgi:hypothetical protein
MKHLINVTSAFPDIPFSDIVSMAGKVAIEEAFCIRVKWRAGRGHCKQEEIERGPEGSIATLSELSPFLKRYSLSPREMAILLAGGHGLKDAVVVTPTGDSPMALQNSGAQWITETVEEAVWIYYDHSPGFEPVFIGSNGVARLPVDMVSSYFLKQKVFFPTVLKDKSNSAYGTHSFEIDDSPQAKDLEKELEEVLASGKFKAEFAQAFSKMLEIGTKDLLFTYPDEPLKCI